MQKQQRESCQEGMQVWTSPGLTLPSSTLAQATLRHWAVGQGHLKQCEVFDVGRSLFCAGAAAERLVSHCGGSLL